MYFGRFFLDFFCTANWTLPMYDFKKPSRDQKSPKQENFRVAKVEGTLRAETFLKKNIEPVIL